MLPPRALWITINVTIYDRKLNFLTLCKNKFKQIFTTLLCGLLLSYPHFLQSVYYSPLYLELLSHCPTIGVSLLYSILHSVIPATFFVCIVVWFLCYIYHCGYLEGSFKVLRLIGVNRVPVSRPQDKDQSVSLLGTFIVSHPNHLVC